MAIHNGRWWIARGAASLVGGSAFLAALWILLSGGPDTALCAGTLKTYNNATVSVARASSKYCTLPDAGMVQLGNNTPSVEAQGVSVEGAATNLALRSEEFDNASWTKNGAIVAAPVVTANAAPAPNAAVTADQIAFPAVVGALAISNVSQQFTGTAVSYSASVYMRDVSGTSTVYLSFCLAAIGVCDGVHYLGTVSCPLTVNWARCATPNVTLTAVAYVVQLGVDLRDSGQVTQASQTIYAWGAQVEAQQASTSYMPTAGSTAARAEDKVTVANPVTVGSPITVGATATPLFNWNTSTSRFLISSGSFFAANTFNAGYSGGGFMGVSSLDATATNRTLNSNAVVTAGFLAHRFTFTINGTTITATKDGVNYPGTLGGSGVTPTAQNATITLGNIQTGGGGPFWGWLSNICADTNPAKCPQ